MAFSGGLARAGHRAERLEVTATCTLDRVDEKPTVTAMHIDVKGSVPGIESDAFQTAAEAAATGCPISRALKGNVEHTVTATLSES
jgi:osmotically inducible protein OsmC